MGLCDHGFVVLTNNWWRMSYDCLWNMCQITIYAYTWGLNFHPFFGSTNQHPQIILHLITQSLLIIPLNTLKKLNIHKNPPLLEFKSLLSNWLDFGKLTQVSPLHCLSVCYICQSVSLLVHVSIYTTQIASHFGQQISLCFVCLSISVSVCLSLYVCIFFNTAADCYHTIWLWAT